MTIGVVSMIKCKSGCHSFSEGKRGVGVVVTNKGKKISIFGERCLKFSQKFCKTFVKQTVYILNFH